MIRTAVLALNNCMNSSVTGPYDILWVASREWRQRFSEKEETLFDLQIISDDGRPVTCFNGVTVTPHAGKDNCGDLDLIFVPVIYGDLESILSDRQLVEWLRIQHEQGVMICAVCAGAFLAAEAGLLNGRKATTHWGLAELFQNRYPKVMLKKEKMIVDEGDVITAGGVTAYMDLSLYLTWRFGSAELASSVSKSLLIDPYRRAQTPYTAFDLNTVHGDTCVIKAQDWMKAHLADTVSVEQLAAVAGLGLRTFARRFKKATGDTPLEYLQHLRIGEARRRLESMDDSVETITGIVGYADTSSFRRLFKRVTGLSPAAYRKRFSLGQPA